MAHTIIHATARGLLLDKDHILLAKGIWKAKEFYYLPGGHIEANEQAQHTVQREFKEETGHTITIDRYLGCIEELRDIDSQNCHSHAYHFIYKITAPGLIQGVIPSTSENIPFEWIAFADLDQIDFLWPVSAQQLTHWLKADLQSSLQTTFNNL